MLTGQVLDVLDATAARKWAVSTLAALGQAREEIDALNVYPVPDGDTGTNLYLTVEGACAAVLSLPAGATVAEVAGAFARGALMDARGNSGVILAQMLHGWADALAERGGMDGPALREAFAAGDTQAWAAVGDPVEGTILSVSRAAAQAAAGMPPAAPLSQIVAAGITAAREALARTPDQLEVLRRAGVVDAGGRGLVVVLEALDDVVHGRRAARRGGRSQRRPLLPPVNLDRCGDLAGDGPAYEVMYLLDAPAEPISALRAALADLGDCLVVVGGAGLWHVHVHVDDPGAAVEAGMLAGRPHSVRITHFAEQVARHRAAAHKATSGLVACAAGPGLARLFSQAGAVVVPTGAGRRPSTGELLAAVRQATASAVAVLPNDADTLSVARAAAAASREEGIRVSVVPTRAQVQGLAAAAVHDAARDFDDDVAQMSAAAGAARDGAVTLAVRDAITAAGPCSVGDALGVVQGEFAVVGDDLRRVAVDVVDRLLSQGGELVTLVVGAQDGQAAAEAVLEHLRRTGRELEISVLDGGQARYPLLLGVE